jgi:ABC-type uncharacterized transport system permease subunit
MAMRSLSALIIAGLTGCTSGRADIASFGNFRVFDLIVLIEGTFSSGSIHLQAMQVPEISVFSVDSLSGHLTSALGVRVFRRCSDNATNS